MPTLQIEGAAVGSNIMVAVANLDTTRNEDVLGRATVVSGVCPRFQVPAATQLVVRIRHPEYVLLEVLVSMGINTRRFRVLQQMDRGIGAGGPDRSTLQELPVQRMPIPEGKRMIRV